MRVWAFKTQQYAPDRLSPDPLARSNHTDYSTQRTNTNESRSALLSNVPPMSSMQHTFGADHAILCHKITSVEMLLRKEVIQPHLPVRLPCYDLVLITSPTFDDSLHKG